MTTKYDAAIAAEIIGQFDSAPEMLVQILQAFVRRYGHISDEAIRQIADALNLSKADVHGVVRFYHDFRTSPPGNHVVKICQAEACQAMGARELTEHTRKQLGVQMHDTTANGGITLEPVYCLGNCACAPAVMINRKVYGRVDVATIDKLLDECGAAK